MGITRTKSKNTIVESLEKLLNSEKFRGKNIYMYKQYLKICVQHYRNDQSLLSKIELKVNI